jgi:MFS family permease
LLAHFTYELKEWIEVDPKLERQVRRNLRCFVVLKMFAKRVFVPLAAIYFVDVSGLTLKEIGALTAWFAAVQFLAEVPTGYFADKIGRTYGIRVGALLNIVAMLCYIFWQHRSGVFIGATFEALGYAFYNGAGEALVHDSLAVQKRERDYTKVLSRAQSKALVVNGVLLALVPMTYTIDKRLPFAVGIVAYAILFAAGSIMGEVRHSVSLARPRRPSLKKLFEKRQLIGFAVFFGFISALFIGILDFNNLAMQDIGLRPERLGWIYAISSFVGIGMGFYMHLLKKVPAWTYAGLDALVIALPLLAAWNRSIELLIAAVILYMSFFRYRRIIYQDYLLTLYPTRYKATLLSAMNNVEALNLLWVPVAISFAVASKGLPFGLGLTGVAVLLVMPFYMLSVKRHFAR